MLIINLNTGARIVDKDGRVLWQGVWFTDDEAERQAVERDVARFRVPVYGWSY